MLARLIDSLKHLFTPRSSNNHRPKALHPQALAVLAAMVVIFNGGIESFALVRGGVLGYASDITADQVLEQTNRKRMELSLPALKQNDQLSAAAGKKAADMFTFNYWAHTNPQNGTEPWYFFDGIGYKYRYAGENLARDFASTAPMVSAWMNSPSHRDNILSPRYQETGIAVVNGILGGMETTLVVQFFGTKQAAAVVGKIGNGDETKIAGESLPKQVAQFPEKSAPVSEPVNFEISRTAAAGLAVNQTSEPNGGRRLISPLDLSKSIGLAALLLIAGIIVMDSFLVWKRKTYRLAGRNWAHLVFVFTLMALVRIINQGIIR